MTNWKNPKFEVEFLEKTETSNQRQKYKLKGAARMQSVTSGILKDMDELSETFALNRRCPRCITNFLQFQKQFAMVI